MKLRTLCVLAALSGPAILASADALAQRGGYGGGMGGGMGGAGRGVGGGYGGMHPGQQPGGPYGGQQSGSQSERGAQQPGAERGPSADRMHVQRTPGEMLQRNAKLSDHLGKLLPAGTDLQGAAKGFDNLGEFVAAVHVSRNLDIPFGDLKQRMTQGESLGEAIRALRPDADAQIEQRRARGQAEQDLGSS